MMNIFRMAQGSKQWLEWRMQGLGGSDICSLLGNSPWPECTRENLWLDKTGRKTFDEDQWQMRMGRVWEPVVRHWYQEFTGLKCEPLCVQHDTEHWILSSLDGWSEAEKIVCEIKCPNAADHAGAIGGRLPEYYFAQVQWQLLATGAKECHYVSYYGHDRAGAPPKFHPSMQYVMVRVKPDLEIQNRIYAIAKEFWQLVELYWANQRVPEQVH